MAQMVIGIRHTFLRDYLHMNLNTELLTNPTDYPFKIRPSKLRLYALSDKKYDPINLGLRLNDYDVINYGLLGEQDEEELKIELNKIVKDLLIIGKTIMNFLTPEVSLELIKKNGEEAWIERLWIEDYTINMKKI